MADEKTDKRAEDYIEKMRKQRGHLPEQWAYLAHKDLDFVEAYDNLSGKAFEDGKALPAKYRALVCIGVLAYRGVGDALVSHIKRALKLGATKQEVIDAIETTIIPGGAPTFGAGLAALMKVEEDEKKGK